MEWKERLNAEISQSGTIEQSYRRNPKDCVLRFAGILSTLKLACATFSALNGMGGTFKRRNISIRNDRTEFSSKFERLRFGTYRYRFDAEIRVRYVRRVEWSGRSVYTPKYLNQERNNRVYVEI
jgi:hypothetical protein